MKYKCGLTEVYVDEIKDGENKGKFGVFLKSKPWEHSKRKDLSPTSIREEMENKLNIYAKNHKLQSKI